MQDAPTTKKRKSNHASSPKRRAEILRAALACFTENGFSNTGIGDICERAGVSVGSLYHHFHSKEALAAMLYLEGIRDYQQGLSRELARKASAHDGVIAIVRYHLGWVKRNRDWAKFLFHQRHAPFMGDSEEEFHKMNMEFVTNISAWIRGHIASGALRRLPPDLFACIILGPCQEYSRIYLSGGYLTPMELAVKEIGASVWHAVRATGEPGGASTKGKSVQ